jgi:hypothetical protein
MVGAKDAHTLLIICDGNWSAGGVYKSNCNLLGLRKPYKKDEEDTDRDEEGERSQIMGPELISLLFAISRKPAFERHARCTSGVRLIHHMSPFEMLGHNRSLLREPVPWGTR